MTDSPEPQLNPLLAEPLPYPDADGEFIRQCFAEMGGHASLPDMQAFCAEKLERYATSARTDGVKLTRQARAGVLEAQCLVNLMHRGVVAAMSEVAADEGWEYDLISGRLRQNTA